MTPFEQTFERLFYLNPWGVAKLAVLLFLAIYIVFAIVVMRQVKLMTGVLNGQMDLPLRSVALVHLILAVGVLLLAIITL